MNGQSRRGSVAGDYERLGAEVGDEAPREFARIATNLVEGFVTEGIAAGVSDVDEIFGW